MLIALASVVLGGTPVGGGRGGLLGSVLGAATIFLLQNFLTSIHVPAVLAPGRLRNDAAGRRADRRLGDRAARATRKGGGNMSALPEIGDPYPARISTAIAARGVPSSARGSPARLPDRAGRRARRDLHLRALVAGGLRLARVDLRDADPRDAARMAAAGQTVRPADRRHRLLDPRIHRRRRDADGPADRDQGLVVRSGPDPDHRPVGDDRRRLAAICRIASASSR